MPTERSVASTVVVPLLRGWRFLTVLIVVSWVLVATLVILGGRKFRAQAALSTVSSARALPTAAGGFAASLLGLSQGGGGIQLTPGVVVRIARMDGVLFAVGTDSLRGRRIVDLIDEREPDDPVVRQRVVPAMRDALTAQYDVQTSVITIAIVHRDSALARAVLGRLIREVSTTFREASRAQAGEIREAQQRRVDSTEARLRAAEQALAQFAARNRAIAEYTPEYVRLQELERAVETASVIHTQALADRDAAWAKQLEETPVVVVIDPPAPELPRERRGLGIKLIMTTFVMFAVGWVFLIGQAALRRLLTEPTSAEADLAAALLHLPMARPVLSVVTGIRLRAHERG